MAGVFVVPCAAWTNPMPEAPASRRAAGMTSSFFWKFMFIVLSYWFVVSCDRFDQAGRLTSFTVLNPDERNVTRK